MNIITIRSSFLIIARQRDVRDNAIDRFESLLKMVPVRFVSGTRETCMQHTHTHTL